MTALIAGLVLAGCVQALPPKPNLLFVAARPPANWPLPHDAAVAAPPEIQAMRFSSLERAAGTDWDGDILTSTNTASVEVGTNLFDFSAPRTQARALPLPLPYDRRAGAVRAARTTCT